MVHLPNVSPKRFQYRVNVKWAEDKRGRLESEGKPDVDVATPPEFNGHEGIWSPEDMLVASVNSCIMMTFLAIAEKREVRFLSYESQAEGTVEMVDGKLMFSSITVRARLSVESDGMKAKALRAMDGAEKRCLVSQSLRSRISLEPVVDVVGTSGE
ncbi:MAG: OsmC family protein [Candidatus Eisenbacteria sp.]|nr:OsmC family protein [Candidatus Eisenbacteria bacterium]